LVTFQVCQLILNFKKLVFSISVSNLKIIKFSGSLELDNNLFIVLRARQVEGVLSCSVVEFKYVKRRLNLFHVFIINPRLLAISQVHFICFLFALLNACYFAVNLILMFLNESH